MICFINTTHFQTNKTFGKTWEDLHTQSAVGSQYLTWQTWLGSQRTCVVEKLFRTPA